MGLTDQQIGMLFSVYNVPNTVMVFVGGMLVDKLGLRKSIFMYSVLVSIGAIVFCIGPYFKNFWVLLAGRFIFGLGAESSYGE